MTARTPKQEILSEMARELAMRRKERHARENDRQGALPPDERIKLLQDGYDFIRENMPDDYRPKTY